MKNLESLCHLCKLSLWKLDIGQNSFDMVGYFGASQGSLDDFLQVVHPEDRADLKNTLLQFSETQSLFEKTFRVRTPEDNAKWVWIRGHIDAKAANRMYGIILGINHWKRSDTTQNRINNRAEELSALAHALAQPLMVINTYISGCIYRLQENTIDNNQLVDILNTIKKHSALITAKIDELKNSLNEPDASERQEKLNGAMPESTLLLAYDLGYFNKF